MAYLKDKITQIKYRLLNSNSPVNKVYFKKGLFYGDYMQEIEYPYIKLSWSNEKRTDYVKKLDSSKRNDSILRTKHMIYMLVHANVGKHGNFKPIFCTLTYEKEQTSLAAARREFNYFIKKLNLYTASKIMYVCVPEIQSKRLIRSSKGVWHFHVVFFNLPYIEIPEFKKLWSFGYVDLQIAKSIKDIGAYLAKYLSKDTYDNRLYGQRSYSTSRGLVRPIESYDDIEIDNFSNNDKVKLIDSKKIDSNNIKINLWKQSV